MLRAVPISILLVALAVPASAAARPADVDRSFGSRGSVTLARLGPDVLARAVAVQADGRVVAAADSGGGLSVLRLTRRGRLDRGFGVRGRVKVTLPGTSAAAARDVAVFRDGRILVAGFADTSALGGRRIAVARLLAGGDLDPGFGVDGVALVGPLGADVETMALGANGEVVLAGAVPNGPRSAVHVMRLLPDGTPDPEFGGGDGSVDSTAPRLAGRARDVLVLNGGGIALAAGPEAGRLARGTFAAVRLTPTGDFDPSFDVDGVARVITSSRRLTEGGASAIALGRGGRLVLAGTTRARDGRDQAAVLRLTRTGSLDRRFGRRGGQRVSGPGPRSLRLEALVRLRSGRLVAGGRTDGSRAVLLGLSASGRRDVRFGRRGLKLLALGRPPRGRRRVSTIGALAAGRDGRVVTGGGVAGPRSVYPTLARLQAR